MSISTVLLQGHYRGMVATALGIVREEGSIKLWQGVTPALYRHIVYRYIYALIYSENITDID